MSQTEFINQCNTWIKNKLLLSNKSHWYKIPYRHAAIQKVKQIFGKHLYENIQFSAGQMALLIKRNEALLETILPVPNNPSYQNSALILKQLIEQAEKIINQYNLIL